MTIFRHQATVFRSGLSPKPEPEPAPETIAEQFLKASRKARGQEPPEPPANPGAAAIVNALRKARGGK